MEGYGGVGVGVGVGVVPEGVEDDVVGGIPVGGEGDGEAGLGAGGGVVVGARLGLGYVVEEEVELVLGVPWVRRQRREIVEDVWVTAVGWKVGSVPREMRTLAGSRVRVSGFTAS